MDASLPPDKTASPNTTAGTGTNSFQTANAQAVETSDSMRADVPGQAMDKVPLPDLEVLERLRQRLNAALVGKENVVELVLTCLLARGHLLFDDLPGLGKTTLAKAIAAAIGANFSRVQCTPDLLPADITGFNLFDPKEREFRFRPGPVFADILLTDEINRTTPRTQSALFEAMAERQVTIDSRSVALSPSFFVIATQNPVESHGAYPLPEAQLDRFTMRLSIGYPEREFEVEMLARNIWSAESTSSGVSAAGDSGPVMSLERLSGMQQRVSGVAVHDKLRGYLIDLCRETRRHHDLPMGISPRGAITWMRCAQASAFLGGRAFVVPDDIQSVAESVLSLRLSPFSAKPEDFVAKLLTMVQVPL
jgi:MoxR-like ATPase